MAKVILIQLKNRKREQQMEDNVIKELHRGILLLNIMMLAALVLIGSVGIALVKRCTSNAAKIAEIAQKTGVECIATTNTLLGIQKITIVK